MNNSTQKTIAKEIILIFALLLIVIITGIGLVIRDVYYLHHEDIYKEHIRNAENKIDSLGKVVGEDLFVQADSAIITSSELQDEIPPPLLDELPPISDELPPLPVGAKLLNETSSHEDYLKIVKYADSLRSVKYYFEQKKDESESHLLYFKGIFLILFYLFGALAIVAYPLRWIYYLLKWAIRILKAVD